MDERETSQTTVQQEKTEENQNEPKPGEQGGKQHNPAQTSEEFYRQISARDDVREILKRLAR